MNRAPSLEQLAGVLDCAPISTRGHELGCPDCHSDDRVTVFHGLADPALACGFHARYYLTEVFRHHHNRSEVSR